MDRSRMELLAEIGRLEKIVTPAPWATDYTCNVWGDCDNPIHDGDSPLLMKMWGGGAEQKANAEFTVLAPQMARIIRDFQRREAVLLGALSECDIHFREIRNDWTDPRHDCHEGRLAIEEAVAKLNADWMGIDNE